MDNIPKVILTPDGYGIVLDKIVTVNIVAYDHGRSQKYNQVYFDIIDTNKSVYCFQYLLENYVDDRETLIIKVNNIRNEILKMINDGNEAKQVLGGIILKKNG